MNYAASQRKPFQFALDLRSGVPVYRQIIDQVTGGMAAGALAAGDQLPTVRQLAVDLEINPNTVIRAYRELEIRGVLETHQGTGTFIGRQLASEFAARVGSSGFTLEEVLEALDDMQRESGKKRR